MKKFLSILLKLVIILVGILLGGAMILTCWLIPLPPGEASLPPVQVVMMENLWTTNPLA